MIYFFLENLKHLGKTTLKNGPNLEGACVNQSIYHVICFFIYLGYYLLSIRPSVRPTDRLSVHPSVCPTVHLSVCPSVCPSVCSSGCPSGCPAANGRGFASAASFSSGLFLGCSAPALRYQIDWPTLGVAGNLAPRPPSELPVVGPYGRKLRV